jgi:hypothetical protein
MSVREHLRAAVIGIVLLGHAIYALPLPEKVTPGELRRIAGGDLAQWRTVLAALGVQWTQQELVEKVVSLTQVTGQVHRTLKTPFRPLFRLVGANQAWALFAGATTEPERLVVDVQHRGEREWTTLLRRMDPCCTWMEDQIRYRRLRGVWDSQNSGMRPAYLGLTEWLATQAFTQFPRVERVRVRIERGRSTYPWEPVDHEIRYVHERVHSRQELRPSAPGG